MKKPAKRLLIVDGYNAMNAWKGEIRPGTLADARAELAERLIDYAGFSGQEIVLVFDAWMSGRTERTREKTGPVTVVYTQKNETADHYIERLCDSLAREVEFGRLEIRVATSDNLEQTIVLGRGATRLSSRELLAEMRAVRKEGTKEPPRPKRATILDRLPEEIRRRLDEMRRGK